MSNVARIVTLREFGADAGVDRLDLAGKDLSGRRADRHCHFLPDGDGRQRLLGHRKIGVDRVELGERCERRADRCVLAEIGVANADAPAKWRPDRLLGDDRLRALHGGGRAVARREGRIKGGLRGVAASHQRPLPGEVRIGVAQLRLPVQEVGLLDRIVDVDQQVAFLHVLPRFEMDRRDHAGDLRGDEDALIGAQRADCGELRRPLLVGRRLRPYGRGFRREGGRNEAFDQGRLDDELEIGEAGRDRGEQRQRDKKHHRTADAEGERPDRDQSDADRGDDPEGDRRRGDRQVSRLRGGPEGQRGEGNNQQHPIDYAYHRCPRLLRIASQRSAKTHV